MQVPINERAACCPARVWCSVQQEREYNLTYNKRESDYKTALVSPGKHNSNSCRFEGCLTVTTLQILYDWASTITRGLQIFNIVAIYSQRTTGLKYLLQFSRNMGELLPAIVEQLTGNCRNLAQ